MSMTKVLTYPKRKIAVLISTISHPLLTTSILILLIIYFKQIKLDLESFYVFIFVNIIPTLAWLYLKTKNGSYTNFDVSDQKQRKSLYLFMLSMLTSTVLILLFKDKLNLFSMGILIGAFMILTSFIVNYFIKVSLHVLINTYIIICLLKINDFLVPFLLIFMISVAWSRVFLKRHSLKEVLTGFVLGFAFGLIFFLQNV